MVWQTHIDTHTLAVWMSEKGLWKGEICKAHLLCGGAQNLLLRFEYNDRELVLRRPPLQVTSCT